MPSVQVSDFEDIVLLVRHVRLVCDFCSSGQRFACGFLQIPPRDGHPCRPANPPAKSPVKPGDIPVGPVEDLHLQVSITHHM